MSNIGQGRPAKHNPNLSPIILELTEERIRQGITQSDIAEAVGVSNRDYISKIENGRYICRYEYLENYASALGFRLGLIRQTSKETSPR